MSEFEFSRLEEVDENIFKNNSRLLIVSKVEYKNTSTDTETQLCLESFVEGHLVLRAYTASSRGSRRYFCDRVFFESLEKREENRRGRGR